MNEFVYVRAWGETLSAYKVDPQSGALTPIAGSPYYVMQPEPPAFAANPQGTFLFSAQLASVYPGKDTGEIVTYSINQNSGELTRVSSASDKLENVLAVDPTGRYLYAAHMSNGISAYSIDQSTGALTLITESPIPAGYNPRRMEFDPQGRFLYAANSGSHNISAYAIQQDGTLKTLAGSPFFAGEGVFALAMSRDGRSIYAADYMGGVVSTYSVDQDSGALSPAYSIPFFYSPVDVTVSPNGRFAYVSGSTTDAIQAYTIDKKTGELSVMPGPILPGTYYPDDPYNTRINATGEFAYVSNAASNTISGFRIDPATCKFTEVPGSPFLTDWFPMYVSIVQTKQGWDVVAQDRKP